MTELLDLTPRFRTFYALAQGVAPDRRWGLWQQHYGFAAVPPVPEGQAMARKLLGDAWDRYAGLPHALEAEAHRLLGQDEAAAPPLELLLGAPVPPHRLVAYVGGFEDNAFAFSDPQPTLCLPVEMAATKAGVILTHELTHLVHHTFSGSLGSWTRALGATIVQEGLAMRATTVLHPDAPLVWRVGERAWLDACQNIRTELIEDALASLEDSDDATLLRFIRPHPQFHLERTAYALGWWLVEDWLKQGRTLAALARVPEAELPGVVRTWMTYTAQRKNPHHNGRGPVQTGS
ncbi:hypothetical protein [Deinococcus frigens]|uniref:hypothetical protein n=1 Tax=Deinococcus frigens TaxID=249403 RepID=UPI0005591B02|nr:hypothetical protein [Deinococcus frigens]